MASSYLASLHQDSPSGIVYPGGCYLQNELIRCALDEFHCQGLEFRSARQMREASSGGDGAADRCRRPHPDYVGMCTSEIDSFHCTGHSSGCVITSKFVPNVPYCTLKHSRFPGRDTHLALYGSCSAIENDNSVSTRCVWSMDECDDGAGGMEGGTVTYAGAAFAAAVDDGSADDDGGGGLCTCDRVRTGACVFNDDWTCAVSADACDVSSSYRTYREVLASGRDCRLCEAFDKTLVVSTDRVRAWRNDDEHGGGEHGGHGGNAQTGGGGGVDACAAGIVAGLAVTGVVVVLLLTLIVTYLCRRGGNDNNDNDDDHEVNGGKPGSAANGGGASSSPPTTTTGQEREEIIPRDGELA